MKYEKQHGSIVKNVWGFECDTEN